MAGDAQPGIKSPPRVIGAYRQTGVIPEFGDLVRTRSAIQYIVPRLPDRGSAAIGLDLVMGGGMAAGFIPSHRRKMVRGIARAGQTGAAPVHLGIRRHRSVKGVEGTVMLHVPDIVPVIDDDRVRVGHLGRIDEKDHDGHGPDGVHIGTVGASARIEVQVIVRRPRPAQQRWRDAPPPARPGHPTRKHDRRPGRRDRAHARSIHRSRSGYRRAGAAVPPISLRPHECRDRHGAGRKGDLDGTGGALNIAGGPGARYRSNGVVQPRGVEDSLLLQGIAPAGLSGRIVTVTSCSDRGMGWDGKSE